MMNRKIFAVSSFYCAVCASTCTSVLFVTGGDLNRDLNLYPVSAAKRIRRQRWKGDLDIWLSLLTNHWRDKSFSFIWRSSNWKRFWLSTTTAPFLSRSRVLMMSWKRSVRLLSRLVICHWLTYWSICFYVFKSRDDQR